MTLEFVDTHCHLQDDAFERSPSGPIERALQSGVVAMVLCGYDEPSNELALSIAADHAGVFPAVGYHPHDAKDLTPARLAVLARQAALPAVVAVGEIGLDFYRDHSPHDVQIEALRAQLDLAIQVGKPVSIHCRSAEDAIFSPLTDYARRSALARSGRPVGVMHCFAGSLAQARSYVDAGFLISIPCTATYPKNAAGRELARDLPLGVLVVETDSPYLPPQQLRGKRNEPAYVRIAAEAVAAARGCSLEAVAAATTENAARLFGLRIGAAA